MSHKSRLRRLDAGVRWLETEGVLIAWQLRMKLAQIQQEIADHLAANPDIAAKHKGLFDVLPPPRVKVRPPARTPPPAPPLPKPVQPPAIEVRPPPLPPPRAPEPPPEPLPGQPVAPRPAHLEIRPVHWRPRGPQDYDEERPGTNGRCIVNYDPFRDEDDDDDDP